MNPKYYGDHFVTYVHHKGPFLNVNVGSSRGLLARKLNRAYIRQNSLDWSDRPVSFLEGPRCCPLEHFRNAFPERTSN